MKQRNICAIIALAFSAVIGTAHAQNGDDREPARENDRHPATPIPPVLAALDPNRDGIIDADEIKNASAALLALDKNGDGKLTMNELMPAPPPRPADGPPQKEGAGTPEGFGQGVSRTDPGRERHLSPGGPAMAAGNGQQHRPPPPLDIPARTLIDALDTNHDGVIDAQELASASESLKRLDTDRDGKLTLYELLQPPQNGGPRDHGSMSQTPREAPGAQEMAAVPLPAALATPAGGSQVPVTFTGGYETDPRDGGRPVVLIAAALKVPSEAFRKAFSNVVPASGGRQPEPEQVRLNKQTLMQSLGGYGVTNDRLDTVSNYYRYNGSRGEMWRNTPATAFAVVRNGEITGFDITNSGSGYSSPPKVSVAGFPNANVAASLSFGVDFQKNGSIKDLTVLPAK